MFHRQNTLTSMQMFSLANRLYEFDELESLWINGALTKGCKWLSYGGDVGWLLLPQLAEWPEAPEPAIGNSLQVNKLVTWLNHWDKAGCRLCDKKEKQRQTTPYIQQVICVVSMYIVGSMTKILIRFTLTHRSLDSEDNFYLGYRNIS